MSTLAPLSPHPRLLVRWFVQYNPFFTASALCVLGGVLLLSRALGQGADVALTGVLELYQWLVIGAAALLYRRLCEHRAGVILGVIALVLLVDPTLQVSALATSSEVALCALWVLSFALKWRALQWAFCLELNASARLLPPLVALLVVALPNLRLHGADVRTLPALAALAVFAVGAVAVIARPRVRSTRALGEVGALMFPRLLRGVALIGALGVAYQVWNAMLALGGRAVPPVLGAVLLVVAVAATRERVVWLALALAAFFLVPSASGAVLGPPLVTAALLMAARGRPPRFLVAAALGVVAAAALPVWRAGVVPWQAPTVIVVAAVATVALALLLWRRRAWSAVPALALVHAPWLVWSARALAPSDSTSWGALLLFSGFVLLPAGVVLHRRLSASLARREMTGGFADTAGPATPAGFGGARLSSAGGHAV